MDCTDAISLEAEPRCDKCGTQFDRRRRQQRFCSEKCARSWHNKATRSRRSKAEPKPRPDSNCKHCGKVFTPTNRRGATPRFCSKKCDSSARSLCRRPRNSPDYDASCVTCGSSFKAKDKRVRFCSGMCQSIGTGHRVSVGCDHCGEQFTRRTHAVKGEHNNFCSRQCHQAFRQNASFKSRPAICEQCGKGFSSKEKRGHWDKCCSMDCSKQFRARHLPAKRLAEWFFEWHSDAPCERSCNVCGVTFSCRNGDWRGKCSHGCNKTERCECVFCGCVFPTAKRDRDSCDSCFSALSGIVADAKARRLAHRNAWLLSGYKHCQGCGEEIPVKCFGDTNRVFCSSCKGMRQREKERLSPKKSKRKSRPRKGSSMRSNWDDLISAGSKQCKRCTSSFPVSNDHDCRRLYCDICKGELAMEKSRLKVKKSGTHRRRARKFNAPSEYVDRLYVFQRDEYKCWLCGKETLKDFAISEGSNCPHPDSPTLDHVIPLSKGGSHSYSNTKCACFLCNCLKRDKIDFVKPDINQ